jgi:2,4-dienoyl-CoA reductase (NADPH2)
VNDLENPLGCYELSRFDGDSFEQRRERMISEVMSVYEPPTFPTQQQRVGTGG